MGAQRSALGRGQRSAGPRSLVVVLAVIVLTVGCSDSSQENASPAPDAMGAAAPSPAAPGSPYSPDAKVDTHAALEEDMATPRHPSDGGGRAFFEGWRAGDPRPAYPVSSHQRLAIVFEAGPLGIAAGGRIFLLTSPFWGWDRPQTEWPEGPGYTEVSTEAEGIEFGLESNGAQMLAIEILGRKLEAGERVRIVYGAGPAGARVDRYAERDTPIHLAVDGDGDGVRALIDEVPSVDILPAPASRIVLTLPSTARPGEEAHLTLATIDSVGNRAPFVGEIRLLPVNDESVKGGGLGTGVQTSLPERIRLDPADAGSTRIGFVAEGSGVLRLRASARGELGSMHGESGPMLLWAGMPRVLWGDLHGHSHASDGTGTPEDYFEYARDVAALDFVALTDHDHWGMRFLDATPEMWAEIKRATIAPHEPGRFVTLLGYEWTSWLHGHRHVLHFDSEAFESAPILSSVDPATRSPQQLWEALAGQEVLTFAHHSAGGPVSTNWRYRPPPELEPVTEITSVHGSSEALDTPGRIYNPIPGNFVRDALAHGYRFGFIGSGDSHDGHPGLSQIAAPAGLGGLAAIQSETLGREALLEALRARRVYATNGPRIYLNVTLDGHPMGSVLPDGEGSGSRGHRLSAEIVASSALERIDLIRGAGTRSIPVEGALAYSIDLEIPRLSPGEFHYIRVVQVDGGAAWSSPIYAP